MGKNVIFYKKTPASIHDHNLKCLFIGLNQNLDCALIIAKPSLLDWQYAAYSCNENCGRLIIACRNYKSDQQPLQEIITIQNIRSQESHLNRDDHIRGPGKMFFKDADLNGTNYDVLIDEVQKFTSIYGSFGILVNKAGGNIATVDAEIKQL